MNIIAIFLLHKGFLMCQYKIQTIQTTVYIYLEHTKQKPVNYKF